MRKIQFQLIVALIFFVGFSSCTGKRKNKCNDCPKFSVVKFEHKING